MTGLWEPSDLPLDAMDDPDAFQPVRSEYGVLVVTGDIWKGDITRSLRAIAKLENGTAAVFVMGNSDYWNEE